MSNFLDIHTHFPSGNAGITEVENLRFGQLASGLTKYCSVGIHPWYLNADEFDTEKQWLDEQSVLTGVCAIGEAGLDKLCDTPRLLQEAAFRYCIGVSERVQKPLVIHCVRAFNEVIQIKKQLKPHQAWIFHGFNKHPDTARMLLKEGCFLSFGAALLKPGNHSAEALQQTPEDRFFLETDDEKDIDIAAIYERAAQLRGISMEQMKVMMDKNAQTFLGMMNDK